MADSSTIYTIGHSDRSLKNLIALLALHKIAVLVDIRVQPYSRRFPHFNQEVLRQAVNQADIDYHWAGRQLGGERELTKSSRHMALKESSMQAFAEYMDSPQFQQAIMQLTNLSQRSPIALMCAEKLPAQCHRSLIADYLVLKDVDVQHIIDNETVQTHQLNELARTESAALIYDRNTTTRLDLH